jgi:hypothetical protein
MKKQSLIFKKVGLLKPQRTFNFLNNKKVQLLSKEKAKFNILKSWAFKTTKNI